MARILKGLMFACLLSSAALADAPLGAIREGFEKSLREAMELPAETAIEFVAEDGTPLGTEAIESTLVGGGSALERVKTPDTTKAVFKFVKKPAESAVKGPEKLPKLNAKDLSGRRVRNQDLAGKPTLLNFYFSTCAPCIKEVPALNAFRQAHPEFNYLAITFDSVDESRHFVKQRQLEWPVIAESRPFMKETAVKGYPTYMLVAKDGRILGRTSGLKFNAGEKIPGLAGLEKWVAEMMKANP
jgi:thiol-disulfide isomerase/thioredoxin